MSERLPRIAFFSDISGTDSLSSHCSMLLLPKLSQEFAIEVFSDSFASEVIGLPHHHYLKAYQRHRAEPFDLFFYQLEDGRRSRFVRSSIGIVPGVTWFHDLFFLDLGPEATHTSPWETSIKQFYDASHPFADRAIAPHQLWPRAYRELSLSPLNLFSSHWAYTESQTMLSNRIEGELGAHRSERLKVPIELGEQAPLPPRETLRVVALCGTGLEGRAHKLLAALRDLSPAWHLTWVVENSDLRAAEILVREFEAGERVRLVPGCSAAEWSRLLESAHVAVHLRASCFGHLAPHLQLSLGSGRLTVVSDMAQGEDLPDHVACKVTPGISEASQLRSILTAACEMDISAATAPARSYVASEHAPALIAQQLSSVLRQAAVSLREPMRRWQGLYHKANAELLREVSELMGSSSDAGLSPFARVMEPAIEELFGQ